jgi:tetratricopeptide (TPR) repeat protein
MRKELKSMIAAFGLVITIGSLALAGEKACAGNDTACIEFANLATMEQFDSIISQVEATETYSEDAKSYIGQAYLAIAGRETNTPAQEEHFCLKALEYGATSAYMGLYFIHASQDPEKALGYLRQYIATKPRDSVPYVLLGEAMMEKEQFEAANELLREARAVARGLSTNLDWNLFQVSYLLGDFEYASTMLDSALSRGQFMKELTDLAADPRYADIGIRPQFRKYQPLIKGMTSLASLR